MCIYIFTCIHIYNASSYMYSYLDAIHTSVKEFQIKQKQPWVAGLRVDKLMSCMDHSKLKEIGTQKTAVLWFNSLERKVFLLLSVSFFFSIKLLKLLQVKTLRIRCSKICLVVFQNHVTTSENIYMYTYIFENF